MTVPTLYIVTLCDTVQSVPNFADIAGNGMSEQQNYQLSNFQKILEKKENEFAVRSLNVMYVLLLRRERTGA